MIRRALPSTACGFCHGSGRCLVRRLLHLPAWATMDYLANIRTSAWGSPVYEPCEHCNGTGKRGTP
jgi:DnaJ-class molecular chaperone